jgi:hypothetical protein
MSILCTKVTWGIAVNIFRIDVGTGHQHSLDHTKVATDRSDVQWSAKVARASINI